MNNKLDPNIWGPHFWFFLHTIAFTYPLKPNQTIKKKYYEFLHNFYLFLPDENIGNKFNKLLVKYPPTPYLDSRMSLMKWTHFIHNKINKILNKDLISFELSLENYHKHYIPKELIVKEKYKYKKLLLYSSISIILLGTSYYLYNK
jgi:hypothetical protein